MLSLTPSISTNAAVDPDNSQQYRINEGNSISVTLSTIGGTASKWTLDWGDGIQQVVAPGAGSTVVPHTYADDSGNSVFQIKATAEDDEDSYDSPTLNLK